MCGHASLSDFKLLPERNGIWSEDIRQYVTKIINECANYKASPPPEPSRKISIRYMTETLNELVCIDHFHLDDLLLIQFIDLNTRFAMSSNVKTTGRTEIILAF